MTLIIPARAIRQSAYSSRKFTNAATNVASRYGERGAWKRGTRMSNCVDLFYFVYKALSLIGKGLEKGTASNRFFLCFNT